MTPFTVYKPIWFIVLIVIGSAEDARQHRLIEQSAAVTMGMTQEQVIEILGKPDIATKAKTFWQLLFLGFDSGQWYWGNSIDLRSIFIPDSTLLNPLPINIRIFSYADHDLVICWGFNDRVTEIRRPEFDVQPISGRILDAWQFACDVFVLLVFKPGG